MDTKIFLNAVCEQIKYKPVRAEISEELEQHINDIKEEYIAKGMEKKEAEEKAVLQMGKAEEIGKELNKIHKPRLDWQLIILICVLTGIGVFATIIKANSNSMFAISANIGNTIAYIILGILLSIGIYFFDYRKLKKHSGLIYLIATIIMLLSLVPGISMRVNGVYYTRLISGVSFPIATVALPLYLISFIGFIIENKKENIIKVHFFGKEFKINKGLIRIIIIILTIISLLLMLLIRSLTNMIILTASYLIVSTIKIIKDKENSTKKLTLMYGIIIVFTIFSIAYMFLQHSFRFEKIGSFINPENDPSGSGYVQMLQREILQKAKIVGEADNMSIPINDSILNIESNYTFIYLIGKCGLLVAGIITITTILISAKLIINAKNIKEQYGKFLIIGLSSLFILQSFATILMNLSLGIQVDVNLPFVTYGGVFFIVNIINMAIVLSVYRRKDINIFNKYDTNKRSGIQIVNILNIKK